MTNVHVITVPGKGQMKLKASDAIETVELFMYACVHIYLSLPFSLSLTLRTFVYACVCSCFLVLNQIFSQN